MIAGYRRGTVLAGGEYGDKGSAYENATAVGGMSYTNPGIYGDDYLYPSANDLAFIKQRMPERPIAKLMVRMERLTTTPSGPLRSVEIPRIQAVLDGAAAAGVGIIINPWNFGAIWTEDTPGTATRHPIGDAVFTQEVFNDFWLRILAEWGDHPALIGLELMTEPVSVPGAAALWETVTQSALDAIRAVDPEMFVWVPTYGWGLSDLYQHPSGPWITGSNYGYSGHQYSYNLGGIEDDYAATLQSAIDQGYTAGSEIDALHTREIEQADNFGSWLNGELGFISEYGFASAQTTSVSAADAEKWAAYGDRMLWVYNYYGWWATAWTSGRVTDPTMTFTLYYPSAGWDTDIDSATSIAAVIEAHPSKGAELQSVNIWLGGIEVPATWSMWKLGQEVEIFWRKQDDEILATTVPVYPSVRSSSSKSQSSSTGGATAKTHPIPPYTQVGDLLVLYIVQDYGAITAMTPPSGWTVAGEQAASGTNTVRHGVYYKIATAGDTSGNITFGMTSDSDAASTMVAVRDWDGVLANISFAMAESTKALKAIPSVTPKVSPGLVLFSGAHDSNASGSFLYDWVAPQGASLAAKGQNATNWSGQGIASEIIQSTAAITGRNWTPSNLTATPTQFLASALTIGGTAQTTQQLLGVYSGGKDGALTDREQQTFVSGGVSGQYHIFAGGLDWSKDVGILIYGDGSGEYGLISGRTTEYLLRGAQGLIAVAKKHNMILLTPMAPGGPCADGDGVCWYDSSPSTGMTPAQKYAWSSALLDYVYSQYNICKSRVAVGGYSSGAQWTTQFFVPQDAHRFMVDGVVVPISYGGIPKVPSQTPQSWKDSVPMIWDVGELDTSYTGLAPTWSDGIQEGEQWYRSNGYNTRITVVGGIGHSRYVDSPDLGEYGRIMDKYITMHVRPA